jgi:hypothetical protein
MLFENDMTFWFQAIFEDFCGGEKANCCSSNIGKLFLPLGYGTMSDHVPLKKQRREMCGLLDVHSRIMQNNTDTDTLTDPIVTPLLLRNSSFSPSRRRRKRKMDDVMSDSVLCVTASRVLGPPNLSTNFSPPCSTDDKSTATENIGTDDNVDVAKASTSSPDKTEDNSNFILPWEKLLHFMSDNFCCRKCHKTISIGNFKKIQVSFATSV